MKLNTDTYRTVQMNARCDVTDLWFQSSFRSSASRQQSVTETRVRISLSMSETGILSAARRPTRWRCQRLEKKKKKLKKSFIQMTRCLSKQTANSVATVASRQLIRVFAFGKRDATYSSLQLRENASLIKNEINKWGKKKKRKKSFTLGNPRQSLTTSGINDEKKPLPADCVWFLSRDDAHVHQRGTCTLTRGYEWICVSVRCLRATAPRGSTIIN